MPAVSSTKPVLSLFRAYKKPLALFTLIVYASLPNLVVAQGVVSAINGKGVALEESANGIPVVNINKPSDGGVSRNEYNQFNVGEEGLILNNSPDIVATQLAGYIDGNSRLEGQQASIILNEVIGANPSQLLGYTEVAGQQAEVVIANQNGITCNGCGFINTPRATLTTGQLMFDGAQFSGFDVSKGKVDIGELGFNGSNVEQIDILARSIDINGDLWANQLNLVTGQNTISTDLEQIEKNTLATSDESSTPEFSLDVAAIGGMYANRIHLVGTEQGLGVNLGGDVIATSNFTLDQSGNITNSGTIAANQVDFTAQSLINNEKGKLISADGGSAISLSERLENSGAITSDQNLTIDTQSFANTGLVQGNNTDVTTALFSNAGNQAKLHAKNELSIDVTNDDIVNEGVIYAGDTVNLDANDKSIVNRNSIEASNNINLTSNAVINGQDNAGSTDALPTIVAREGQLNIQTTELENTALIAGDSIQIASQQFRNHGRQAKIQAGSSISIDVESDINNTEGALIYSAGNTSLTTQNNVNNSNAILAADGDFDFVGQAFNNYSADSNNNFAALQVVGNATLSTNQINNSLGSVIATENGLLDMDNSGAISNTGLIAGAQVDITTDAITNSGVDAQIQAKESLSIAAIQTWYNKMGALIFSEGVASLSSQGYFYNDSGIVETLGALSIDAERIYNQKNTHHNEKGYLVSSGDMSVTGSLYNKVAAIQSNGNFNQDQGLFHNESTGVVKAVNGEATFNSTDWDNYGFVGGNKLDITAKTIDNDGDKALVLAHENLRMKTTLGDLRNRNGGVLYSFGSAGFDVDGTLLNESSIIETSGSLFITAGELTNKRTVFITDVDDYDIDRRTNYVIATDLEDYFPNYIYDLIEKDRLPGGYIHKMVENSITTREVFTIEEMSQESFILSGDNIDLNIKGAIRNEYSTISALGNNDAASFDVINFEFEEKQIDKKTGKYTFVILSKCNWPERCLKGRDRAPSNPRDIRHPPKVVDSSNNSDFKKVVSTISANKKLSIKAETISNGTSDKANESDSVVINAPKDVSDKSTDIITSEIINAGSNLDDLSYGALFSQVDNGNHGYLIETNPNFTEYQNFISSDYMLERMGVDINENDAVRLGDGYFEQDLVRDQILDLTGVQFVDDSQSIQDQYIALMENALTAKENLTLSIGVELTLEQIEALDKPIVWMVEKQFETKDGVKTALVPQVYFNDTMGLSLREDGALIAADTVDLEATNEIANAGVIKAKDKLKLVANDIKNTNKLVSKNEMDLVAQRDIHNASGLIDSARININAGRDFINQTQVEVVDLSGANSTFKQSLVGDTATINAQELNITAGNDVKFIGSDVNVEGDLVVEAVNNIEMTTAKIIEEAISGNFYNVSSTQHQTTEIGAGTVLMIAGGTVKSEGAKVASDGNLEIDANDIQLLAVKNTEDKDIFYNYGGGDTEHTQSHSEEVIASAFTSDGVLTLSSKNDIISKGTQFSGKDGVNLSAEGNVLLATETALNTSRVDKTSKSSGFGGSTRRASTEINESLTHLGSSINSDGSITIQSGGNTALVGSTIEAGENVNLDATGDLLVSAAVNDSFNQYTKTKKGSFTQSSQNKGAKTQEAIASSISAGTNLNINTAGNVTVKGSDLSAQETMTIGDDVIAQSQDGSAQLSPDGQFVNQEGEQVGNVTVTTQELKNESWNEKSSGFSGILKDIASGVSLMVSSVAATAGIPVDAEIEVGSSSSERSQQTIQQASNLQAKNLNVDVAGDVAVIGSNATVQDTANIDAQSFTMDAAKESSSYSKTESTTTVSSSAPSVGENEITVANLSETKTSTTEATTSTTWSGSSLNAGNLNINTDKAVNIVSSDVTVQGDTDIQAEDIVVSGRQDTTETTTTLKEEIKTVSVGVKNAYVDTAQAIEELNSAKNAVRDAKQAYDDAKQKIADGQMPASELKYFETNIAAATANLTNATIAVASAGATAAGTTGTGGFYATGNASVETNESSSTEVSSTWNGSNVNLGGNATLQAQDEIQVKGSNVAVGGELQLDAEDINLLAGENSTQTSSDSSSHTESASYSTNGGPSGSLSANKTESSSESQYYTNTQIVAGSLSSDSENLTLSGANVDAGVVDISTENLLVESLQNTSTSNSQTQGANLSLGGVAPPTSGGINQQQSESSSAWVDQQSSITGGNVSIKAKDTTLRGGLIAAQDENGADNGNLNFVTDTLTVENIQDHDTSSDKGFSLNTGASTTTVGANYSGHDKRQTTKATIGNGNVTVGGEQLAETDIDVNRDTSNAQEITKNHELGGLDATVTVDHRLASEEGRQDIANDFEDTAEHGQDIARTTSKLIEDDNLNALNFGETLHNNAQATQLKNDLVRNPENAELLAGLKSDDPEVYAQAVKDLGQLAQAKFGLDLSEVDLYDGEKTTSGSLGDNALTDVKGGTVVDKNNANAGDIFVDAGDGASKTDMANTLGHEVLESQDFQGKDSSLTGGLFGTNTDSQQESLANAFGEQFSDRINQAAGGNLDSTGGADFSNNLKNSQAVQAGTQKANTVGNAIVEHRQLYVSEAKAIIDHAQTYADRHDISLDQAKQELTQQALLQVDSEWADQAHIQENDRAREGLKEIAAEIPPIKDAYVNGGLVGAFIATPPDKENQYINANQARMIEDGAAGEDNYMSKYATENGELSVELTPMQQVGETVDGIVNGAISIGEGLIEDYPGTMDDMVQVIRDGVGGCVDAGLDCVLSDPREGYSGDRAFVDLLQGDRESAVSNNNIELAGEVAPVLPVVLKLKNIDLSGQTVDTQIGAGTNGSYNAENDFDGKNPSDSTAQETDLQAKKELVESKLLSAQEITGAYTKNNKAEDLKLYEDLKRAEQRTEPEYKRDPKSAGFDAGDRILTGIKNILEGLDSAE
ncbi:filamentous hemagglutinin N-terminal domain-containing protein [Bermanella marisrubri]|uniref:Putative hemagglutinin/hemolysin-related protein n=1 Tax=Bermanella marisrubri TaxID=207949 RepID=Q1N5Z2_9GAMM|nr:hemagglutinin repeat-containing protein [Bermanella marisrubri]EAT13800.1 putative hemagglutinin/hemolysin-related protein [Oceanobacter sp. RED65] [Bermanella marisrubri]QIZ84569.1 filamentous hemagglutinin N-terminal domain-containing protein [Bermanella marisrubri]